MKRKNRPLVSLNTIIYILLVVVSLWIIYLMIYGHGGILERKKIINEITLLHREIDNLKSEKSRFKWEIENLISNKDYLAGLAHENGYREENETVFKFLKRDGVKVIDKLQNTSR